MQIYHEIFNASKTEFYEIEKLKAATPLSWTAVGLNGSPNVNTISMSITISVSVAKIIIHGK